MWSEKSVASIVRSRCLFGMVIVHLLAGGRVFGKSYWLSSAQPSPSLVSLNTERAHRPFRVGMIRLSPKLDREKPLASVDYGGFVFASGLLLGSVRSDQFVALTLPLKKVSWQAPIVGGVTTRPLVFGGWIFVADRSGVLYKISLVEGKVQWQARLDSFVSRPITKVGSSLFLLTANQTLYHVDSESGQINWAVDQARSDRDLIIRSETSPLVVNTVVYHGTTRGEIVATNIDTGKESWRVNPRFFSGEFKEIVGEMVYTDGRILFARHDGTVGSLRTSSPQESLHLWENGKQLSGVSTSAYRAGRYYVGTASGQVIAFSSSTGRRLWVNQLGVSITFMSVGEKSIYCATSSGLVAALRVQDGTIRWYDELGESIVTPPVYRDKDLYFATGNRNLYGYAL